MTVSIWPYTPSTGANLLFLFIFFLLFVIELVNVFLAKRKYKQRVEKIKSRRYVNQQIPFLVGLALETIGYGLRIQARSQKDSILVYSLQSLCILLAPVFVAATMYMLLGQIILVLRAEKLSLIKVKFLTKIFVAGDIISFFLQAIGGGTMVVDILKDLGKILAVVGLVVQLVFFFVFICTSFHFWYKLYTIRPNSSKSSLLTAGPENKVQFLLANNLSSWGNWLHALFCLQFASILVLIRSIYRAIEFSQGFNGPLQSLESIFFGLDSVMIGLSCFALISVNYSRFFHKLEWYHNTAYEEIPIRSL